MINHHESQWFHLRFHLKFWKAKRLEKALKEWNASETECRRSECQVRVLEQETANDGCPGDVDGDFYGEPMVIDWDLTAIYWRFIGDLLVYWFMGDLLVI